MFSKEFLTEALAEAKSRIANLEEKLKEHETKYKNLSNSRSEYPSYAVMENYLHDIDWTKRGINYIQKAADKIEIEISQLSEVTP